MRVIFMGSPDFSVSALDALIDAGHEIACVYCQPPRPAGRGKKDRPTAVQVRAEELGLLVRHPLNFKDPADVAAFAELKADIAVVVAYGLILPQSILDAPSKGCLNIHASLLPRWRGAAPIHRAIMAGDEKTGVCIMQMDAGLDTGDVLRRDELVIGATETTADLHDRLAVMGADLIVQSLEKYDDLSPAPQPEEGVNYAHKIDKAEAQIDWSRPAVEIDRQIRGLSPFPGAWCMLGKDRLKLLGSELAEGAGAAGEVLDDHLLIACGEGAVRLTRLQRAGKGGQDAEVFQRGKPIEKGTVL
ncbi:methionyl-tRNA formyltransferase [Thalassobius sp. I31.1]|uniref:methionyl-tRNA formyltransferase n=1 Tax=Thalassobius sp. I31.1 TaxID=2109912 RepID=UPI000D1BA48D|nr:methionyl-tRNA formyltransferase [Thalassobius sp. I31.1]